MLNTCFAHRCIQYVIFICFHNVSDFHLNNLIYSIWMPVWKFCYWDLRFMWMVWQVCMFCWHFHVCLCVCARLHSSMCAVCMCVHIQMILCCSVPEIMAVHILCVLTGRGEWEQWEEVCKGCTAAVVPAQN